MICAIVLSLLTGSVTKGEFTLRLLCAKLAAGALDEHRTRATDRTESIVYSWLAAKLIDIKVAFPEPLRIRIVSNLARRLRLLLKPRRFPVLYNVNGARINSSLGRALLVYKAQSFLTPPDSKWFLGHQNRRQAREIGRLLGEFGYIVDVVDSFDVKERGLQPARKYDVILSARAEARIPDSPLLRDARRLFLATTIDHHVHNGNLRRRHELLRQRRGHEVEVRRKYSEKMPSAASAHAIIGFGNVSALQTWRETSDAPKYPFNNSGYDGTRFIFDAKDFAKARKNFLFFASGGQVQKGLDLLLEIFSQHPEWSLFVCSGFADEPEFCRCYHRELFETSNVHPIGWVEVNSPKFYELIAHCACVVSTSCSEGQAGGTVQCMYAGLVPLVTRATGVDVEGFGMVFEDDSLKEIERKLLQVAAMPPDWHRERSRKTRAIAEERFSEASFVARWQEILDEVLPHKKNRTLSNAKQLAKT